jgi:hypothetical protein
MESGAGKMRITKRQLRRIIREQISATPTGRIEVEWDFYVEGDEAWNALSYEEQQAQADLSDVVDIEPDLMADYLARVERHGESQADDMITNLLSDETGWLVQGWSWI